MRITPLGISRRLVPSRFHRSIIATNKHLSYVPKVQLGQHNPPRPVRIKPRGDSDLRAGVRANTFLHNTDMTVRPFLCR